MQSVKLHNQLKALQGELIKVYASTGAFGHLATSVISLNASTYFGLFHH